MKITFLKLGVILLLLGVVFAGCNESKSEQTLLNTQWRLVGMVDVATSELRVLEPRDCERCYTISFEVNGSLTGFSSTNSMIGNYEVDSEKGTIFIHFWTMTEVGEYPDGDLFVDIFSTTQSFPFLLQNNELRLYYNDKRNYLLFKLHACNKNGKEGTHYFECGRIYINETEFVLMSIEPKQGNANTDGVLRKENHTTRIISWGHWYWVEHFNERNWERVEFPGYITWAPGTFYLYPGEVFEDAANLYSLVKLFVPESEVKKGWYRMKRVITLNSDESNNTDIILCAEFEIR